VIFQPAKLKGPFLAILYTQRELKGSRVNEMVLHCMKFSSLDFSQVLDKVTRISVPSVRIKYDIA